MSQEFGANLEQYRAGFEAWARKEGYELRRDSRGFYFHSHAAVAWMTWTASKREASTEPSAKPEAWMVPISGMYEYFATEAAAKRERAEYEREMADDPDLVHLEPVPLYTRAAGALSDDATALLVRIARNPENVAHDSLLRDDLRNFIARLPAASRKARLAPSGGAVPVTDDAKDAVPAEASIAVVRAAIADYYRALNARQHGGLAMDRSFRAIERELGMSWDMWTRAESAHTKAGSGK